MSRKIHDEPVTMKLLSLVKQELTGEISTLRLEMRAGFTKMESRFLQSDSKFEALQTQMTKMMVILEEQNNRNKIALDGYALVYEKLQQTDTRLEKMEKYMFGAV